MAGSPIETALNLAASAALLVWAVRLVRTGFERAFGSEMRRLLRRSTDSTLRAAGTGLTAAVLLQSSTAVALLLSGFMTSGAISGYAGLAIILGADLGSALVVQLLNSGLSVLMPLLLLTGVLTFLRSSRRTVRQVGRILIGFALIFVSLAMIRDASTPLISSPGARTALGYLATDLISAFAIATLFAWLVHSSVAAVLLFATLAAQGVLPPNAAFAMVLGANLGGALIAFFLTLSADLQIRQVVMSNLVLRGGGAVVTLSLLSQLNIAALLPGADPADQALGLHLIFNIALLVVGLFALRPTLWLSQKLLPETAQPANDNRPRTLLDPTVQTQPLRAFGCVQRELVDISNRVENMLRDAMPLFETYNAFTAKALREQANDITQASLNLRVYISGVRSEDKSVDTGVRAFALAGSAVNIEAAADVVGRQITDLAKRKHTEKVNFSDEGWRELTDFHDTVLRNIQHGITVLMTEDIGLARDLVAQKEQIRSLEQSLSKEHLKRLRNGSNDTVETSSLHLGLLRALKALNTSFAMIAYPLLTEKGELRGSRLKNDGLRQTGR